MAASADSVSMLSKQCTKCGISKLLSLFVSDKSAKSGFAARCKECHKAATLEWRIANPDKQKAAENRWKAENADQRKEYGVKYYAANKDAHADRVRSYRSRNPDKVAKFNATSYSNRSSSSKYRVEAAIRTAVNRTIRLGTKESRTFELLGYSSSDLMSHLEKQFLPGMTWENYGDWHIDHEIPLVAHEYETADDADFKRAWALTNLQPLWAIDNIKKGGRIFAMTAP